MSDEQKKPEQIHRRDILKWGAMAGAAVAIGASGLGGLAPLVQTAAKPSKRMKRGGADCSVLRNYLKLKLLILLLALSVWARIQQISWLSSLLLPQIK